MFQDYLFFGTDVQMQYAYRMANISHLAQEAQEKHKLSNEDALKLAETLLSSVLVASILDDDERLNLRIYAESEYLVSAETTRFAEVKGFFQALEGEAQKPSSESQGEQYHIFETRTLRSRSGENKLSESHTKFATVNIEDAVNDHLRQSYQMQAQLRLQAWVSPKDQKIRCFGVIYLELPKIPEAVAQKLWDHVWSMESLKDIFEKSDDPDRLASAIIPDKTRAINSIKPTWKCTCSLSAIEEMLMRLPQNELGEIIKEQEPAVVNCHYCGQEYKVTVDRLHELLASASLTKQQTSDKSKLN